ncbi:alpha/beta fold hydrolase [Bradyrhizobium septentrionale]|uniref:Alpha/beta fold hydrolase n=1 Tax=Bradyrhizobium septentrionale TaxID=1404411 RepID=A0A973W4K7_9BRAD|nr:alpha/beta hydrolase [Bradyrhizobium septentrionale]UGY16178.1 alpha/beta fold hydrolase [Bradyrhizobium septentrionale]UGY24813.1 alpha/beta fold hydrolase [Bradyrhizobium septentrionale]
MASFSVRTLGFPEVRCDDRLRPLALRKGLALLVYLAEAKGPAGRDAIATMLWPESPAEVVRARLRRLLHRLQLALGDVIASDRSTVRLSAGIKLDVDSRLFEQACDRGEFERACGLYQADFLDGFSPGDCPQFDEWAFFRREALRGRAIQALERVVQEKHAAGDYASAAAHAGRLVALDPLSEIYSRHFIRNLLLGGDRAAAERQLKALTQRLRNELDVAPEAETSALLEAGAAEPPTTQYVSGGNVHLAFQTYGKGPTDVLMLTGFVSHVERVWEDARCRAFLSSLAAMGRLVLLDRRGVGLSDRVGFTPNAEATAQDIRTVLDATGSRRVVLFGASEGGPACIRFAADHPDRVAGLILFASLAKGSAAPDYPHALHAEQYDAWLQQLVSAWGGPAGIETFAPSLAGDAKARAWWAGLLRAASSPGAIRGVLETLRDTDVRHLLGRVAVPTLVLHRRADRAVRIGAGRHLADNIPHARFVELDGADHWAFAGDGQAVLDNVRQFVGDLAE